MVVTKQTYTAAAPWTQAQAAAIFRSAFIDAGLMTEWHDSFDTNISNVTRVLKVEHNGAKVYGKSFYALNFSYGYIRVHIASGWKEAGTAPINIPTGTQYIDYRWLPADYSSFRGSQVIDGSVNSNLYLDRFTSADDAKQSWFVARCGSTISKPFSFLRGDTTLQPWLNLDKGIISGFLRANPQTSGRAGFVGFSTEEGVRRCLVIGTALNGQQAEFAFHNINCCMQSYVGAGLTSTDNLYSSNLPDVAYSTGRMSSFLLPVGKNAANPAFASDYIPICSDLGWSPWTPTALANDFGIYMHYAANTIGYGNRFVVQSGINEWEVIGFSNNQYVTFGASATFLARVV